MQEEQQAKQAEAEPKKKKGKKQEEEPPKDNKVVDIATRRKKKIAETAKEEAKPEESPEEDKPEESPEEAEKKEKEGAVRKREFSRFMTKGQFALLSDEDKAAYLDKFKSSSHKERPPRVKARPSSSIHDFSHEYTEEELQSMHEELQSELEGMNTENRASINRESIGAANDVSTDDLKEAGEDLRNNSEEIAEGVAKRFQNRPQLLKTGLSNLRKMWGTADTTPNEDDDEEHAEMKEMLSLKEKRQTRDMLTQVTKYALLGAGIVALAAAATPVAFVIGHVLFDMYGDDLMKRRDGSKDLEVDKAMMKNRKLQKENDLMKNAERERKEQIKAKLRAQREEEKRRKEEEEAEERAERLNEAAEDDQTKSDEEPLEPKEQEDADTKETDSDEDESELKVAASAHKNDLGTGIEYSHEDDANTLQEVIKHIGTYLETVDANTIRDNMRVAYGNKANHLVSESSAVFESIDAFASAFDGQVDGNFVVTASARYEYNETTGRYGHAKD